MPQTNALTSQVFLIPYTNIIKQVHNFASSFFLLLSHSTHIKFQRHHENDKSHEEAQVLVKKEAKKEA